METIDADQIADIMAGRPVRPPKPTQSSSGPSSGGGSAPTPDPAPSANPA
jgi:cell division protease FtsH